jgi:hypothetical protein
MAASKCIGPTEAYDLGFSNLVGLLYSIELRIGEALKLTIGDVELRGARFHFFRNFVRIIVGAWPEPKRFPSVVSERPRLDLPKLR